MTNENALNKMMNDVARRPAEAQMMSQYLTKEQIEQVLSNMKAAHEKALEVFGQAYANLENMGFEVVAQEFAASIKQLQDKQIEMYLEAKKQLEQKAR